MVNLIMLVGLMLVRFSQSHREISADCNRNISLPCDEINNTSVRTLTWYKVIQGKRLGIVMNINSIVKHFNFSRPVIFGEEQSLFLPNVNPGDSGIYECDIGANIDYKNLRSVVTLTVTECVSLIYTTSLTDKITYEEFPVSWIIVGFLIVGLLKIAVSLTTIQVAKAICKKFFKENTTMVGLSSM